MCRVKYRSVCHSYGSGFSRSRWTRGGYADVLFYCFDSTGQVVSCRGPSKATSPVGGLILAGISCNWA